MTGRVSSFLEISTSEIENHINWSMKDDDHMLFNRNSQHYRDVGKSALRCIFASLLLSNANSPSTIMDFGCGSGRVLRWIKAAFPNASIYASDVRQDALDFCGRTFDIKTWRSRSEVAALEAPLSFDLIWSGSVLTHMNEYSTRIMISKFVDWLKPGGVAVFTTQGRRAVGNMSQRRLRYADESTSQKMIAQFGEGKFAFAPFKNSSDLGNSFVPLPMILNTVMNLNARVVTISEAAWDKHQDVVAIQRTPADLDLAF